MRTAKETDRQTDRQTDRHDEMNSQLFVILRSRQLLNLITVTVNSAYVTVK